MTYIHHFRDATAEDLEFQKQLYTTTREDEMDAAGFPQKMREAFIEMQFTAQTTHYTTHHPHAKWLIIECDNTRAGRLILDMNLERSDLNIMDIALMPEFRGKGIGSAILKDILADAELKNHTVRLFAFTGERAIQLYHRLGFVDLNVDEIHTELVWKPGVNARHDTRHPGTALQPQGSR
jgi:GNAT superfamily N-acetyltransferase